MGDLEYKDLPPCPECGAPDFRKADPGDWAVSVVLPLDDMLEAAGREEMWADYGRKVAYSMRHAAQQEYCKRNGHTWEGHSPEKPRAIPDTMVQCVTCNRVVMKEEVDALARS